MRAPTADDLRAAAERVKPAVVVTPLLEPAVLAARTGRRVLVKPEMLQHTGSFKFRGAYNFLATIDASARSRGVVAYSSGNHGQATAAAAALFGVPAVVVMPADAPGIKVERTSGWGAEVVSYDRRKENREEIAAAIAADRGMTLVPPYDHPWTVAGQGTIGLELAAQLIDAEASSAAVAVPCSGGGLLSGICLGLAADAPRARAYGVEPEEFDDAARSLRAGRRLGNNGSGETICDALMSDTSELTFGVIAEHAAGVALVSDAEVLDAIAFAFRELKLVVEPGGAVALAALLAGKVPGDDPVAVVLSGGNIDPALLATALA